jgi:hypothetical protein
MQLFTITPTLATGSAYAAGNLMGGKNTLLNALPGGGVNGILRGAVLIDKSNQNAPLDLVFFSADLTGTTFTDKAAFAPVAADLAGFIGHQSIVAGDYASDYASFSANSVGTKAGLQTVLMGAATLYMAIVCRGTPTYVGATDLTVKLFIDA